MHKYDVLDEIIIYADSKTVYNAILSEFSGQTSYWMPQFSAKLLKGKAPDHIGALIFMVVHSTPRIIFLVKTIEVKKNKMLLVKYIKGAFRGEGLWKFEDIGGLTKLSFHWRANPSWLMFKLLDPFINVPKMHSKVIQVGFRQLKKNLSKRR